MTEEFERLRRLAARASEQDPTGWFEQLYAAARTGSLALPWDRGAAHPLLADWTSRDGVDGHGRTAVVVGCGPGSDAEHLAAKGYTTTAFDVAPTAVATARERHPGTAVHYTTADLLALPEDWRGAFDLVLESLTVQSLPIRLHPQAIDAVASLVAPGGTLLVISGAREDGEDLDGPPWLLTRAEVDLFSAADLEAVSVEKLPAADGGPGGLRWRVELRRAGT
jgi:SAM-dependent methyltransferase